MARRRIVHWCSFWTFLDPGSGKAEATRRSVRHTDPVAVDEHFLPDLEQRGIVQLDHLDCPVPPQYLNDPDVLPPLHGKGGLHDGGNMGIVDPQRRIARERSAHLRHRARFIPVAVPDGEHGGAVRPHTRVLNRAARGLRQHFAVTGGLRIVRNAAVAISATTLVAATGIHLCTVCGRRCRSRRARRTACARSRFPFRSFVGYETSLSPRSHSLRKRPTIRHPSALFSPEVAS